MHIYKYNRLDYIFENIRIYSNIQKKIRIRIRIFETKFYNLEYEYEYEYDIRIYSVFEYQTNTNTYLCLKLIFIQKKRMFIIRKIQCFTVNIALFFIRKKYFPLKNFPGKSFLLAWKEIHCKTLFCTFFIGKFQNWRPFWFAFWQLKSYFLKVG